MGMFSSPKFYIRLFAWITVFFLICGLAHGTPIFIGDMTITPVDPTQLGRISRDGVPSDWSGPKTFPGVLNPATSYHYTMLDLDLSALVAPSVSDLYIQISIDSNSTFTFLSAYENTFNPVDISSNYLGDPGFSGNFFGTDPLFFQIVVPYNDHLVLVLNETTNNGLGLFSPAGVLVEAFADTSYTDVPIQTSPAPVPEPGTWTLLACGLAFLTVHRFRRRASSRHPSRL
jgi:hypothetical protein